MVSSIAEIIFEDGSKVNGNPAGNLIVIPPNSHALEAGFVFTNIMLLRYVDGTVLTALPIGDIFWKVTTNIPIGGPGDYPFIWPFNPDFATSEYGPRVNPVTGQTQNHSGIDISTGGGAYPGAPIPACGAGTVAAVLPAGSAGFPGGTSWGNRVLIDHGQVDGVNLRSGYAHMQHGGFPAVSVNDSVEPGDIIGYVGTTGQSTGEHLHFSTWINGGLVNPRDFMATYNPSGIVNVP